MENKIEENLSSKRRQLYKDYHQQGDFQDGNTNLSKDDAFPTQQRWPFLLWLYLKSLGLYHEGLLTVIHSLNKYLYKRFSFSF